MSARRILGAAPLVLCGLARPAQHTRSDREAFVGVFLTSESRAVLDRRLARLALPGSASGAAVLCPVGSEDAFVLEPLFGERAAFRLVRVVQRDGALRAEGRVSTVVGPVAVSAEQPAFIALSRAPSLPPLASSVEVLPNLVLEGRICSSLFVEDTCHCSFDRSSIAPVPSAPAATGAPPSAAPECPICAFMKAGPCAAQFEAWTACMEGADPDAADAPCVALTTAMTRCMVQHEHYDVFVAGMSEKLEAIEQHRGGLASAT